MEDPENKFDNLCLKWEYESGVPVPMPPSPEEERRLGREELNKIIARCNAIKKKSADSAGEDN